MNNNCLAGYRCLRCGSEGPFNIETEDFIEWKDNGAAYCYEPEFKPGGTRTCSRCAYNGYKTFVGKEKDFRHGFIQWLARRLRPAAAPELRLMVRERKLKETEQLEMDGTNAQLEYLIDCSGAEAIYETLEDSDKILKESESDK